MIRIPKNRPATHPGEMLLEEFLIPLGITQKELADAIRVPFQRVNQIVAGKRGVTPSTALRLGRFFNMSPSFWLNLQMRRDLQQAESNEHIVLQEIRPIRRASAR